MAINTIIATNIMALTAHRNLGSVGNKQNKANKRLSSGKKINSAADDAAGLAISEKMKAQIKGLDMASKNSEDTISLIQTAEGSLAEVNNMLIRIRELTVQAGNDSNQQSDRVKIAEEVATLLTEIDSISSRTEFNEKKLNNGSLEDAFFQIGAGSNQKLELSIGNMSVGATGMNEILDIFGLKKRINMEISSSQPGVVVSHGVRQNAQSGKLEVNDIEPVVKGSLTLQVTDNVTGESEKLNFDFNIPNPPVSKNPSEIANLVAESLNRNEEFKKYFTASMQNGALGAQLIITNKDVGAELGLTGIGVDLYTNKGERNGGITYNGAGGVLGYHGQINVDAMSEYETVRIGDEVYTKVPAEKVSETINGFNSREDLQKILQDKKINATITQTNNTNILQINYADHQNSPLPGKYSVRDKKVSDKGADYSKALDTIDGALNLVTTQRANLGANQNRLEYTMKNLNVSSENLNASRSRIEDADMAKEMMNLTKANVLQQAATSILAQANQAPNNITQLLG